MLRPFKVLKTLLKKALSLLNKTMYYISILPHNSPASTVKKFVEFVDNVKG